MGSAALPALFKGGQELRPVRVPVSALNLGELGHELAAVELAVGRNTVIGNEISHGSDSIGASVAHQLPFVHILNALLQTPTPKGGRLPRAGDSARPKPSACMICSRLLRATCAGHPRARPN